ncbi:HupE/UreJ family protein [Thiorhodococcus minor]|uniref:HupE/UreJ family protein n=1 Tax=Thiorhodococcus minor TaxID=57489 RepID=A0A6M0JTY1_9GAMM|nr:HupE/UreJ family protein [Thiorhodococcus minor]NEV60978.1 HupE/UreJ family protein [Thiorhodococcus minor]
MDYQPAASVTLALAVLGWVSVPIPPIEASIALSIAFVAREAILPQASRRHGFWLVAAFGLLHGLGFASALAEIGVDPRHLLLSLLVFNVGVELGQLLFIGGVLGAMMAARRILVMDSRRLRSATAFGLGTLGMVWTFERVTGFL